MIMAFTHTSDFDYAVGDATVAYQQPSVWKGPIELCAVSEGIENMVRHVVFVRPATFVILDDLQTEQPAGVQFLLHALNAFEIDEASRLITIVNDQASARISMLDAGPVSFSQTDQFTHPPEQRAGAGPMPNQWHLTADFAATKSSIFCISPEGIPSNKLITSFGLSPSTITFPKGVVMWIFMVPVNFSSLALSDDVDVACISFPSSYFSFLHQP